MSCSKVAVALVVSLGLTACASVEERANDRADEVNEQVEDRPLQARAADRIVQVSDANRAVRACLFSAAFLEVQVAKVGSLQPDRRDQILGNISTIEATLQNVRERENRFWHNTDLGYVALSIGRVVGGTTKDKILDYISRGFSFETAVFGIRSAAIDLVIGSAAWRDVVSGLESLESGDLSQDEAWKACDRRMDLQRDRLTVSTQN